MRSVQPAIWRSSVQAIVLATQLLSRLPIRTATAPTEADYGRSVVAYPLIGLMLGGILMVTHALLANQVALLQAAMLLSLWVAFSGALHLDGLADSVDAWVGGLGDRDRSLAIMKDPRSGPMAVTALVVLLLLKFAALSVVLAQSPGYWLVAAPLLGRAALVAAFLFIPYVSSNGLGAAHARALPRYPALTVLILSCLAVMLAGPAGLLGVAVAALLFWLVRRASMRRLGGFTGDIAGALCELTETALLLILALATGPFSY